MARGPEPEYTDDDILRFFAEAPDPVYFAAEVAEHFNKSRQWAYNNLNNLVDEGLLMTKKKGERTRVYWIGREGRQYLYDRRSDSPGNQ